ncbi:MAG: hypothetical protein H7Y11_05205, partial [Armatimonadetes bacterium]|nr:hypothetical protein [Anaerolineae bacterium]
SAFSSKNSTFSPDGTHVTVQDSGMYRVADGQFTPGLQLLNQPGLMSIYGVVLVYDPSAQQTEGIAQVNVPALAYAEPDETTEPLSQPIPTLTWLTIKAQSDDGAWYQVVYDDVTTWVMAAAVTTVYLPPPL